MELFLSKGHLHLLYPRYRAPKHFKDREYHRSNEVPNTPSPDECGAQSFKPLRVLGVSAIFYNRNYYECPKYLQCIVSKKLPVTLYTIPKHILLQNKRLSTTIKFLSAAAYTTRKALAGANRTGGYDGG